MYFPTKQSLWEATLEYNSHSNYWTVVITAYENTQKEMLSDKHNGEKNMFCNNTWKQMESEWSGNKEDCWYGKSWKW